MIIGVDLDNTIICYDQLFKKVAYSLHLLPKSFYGDKNKIRDFIISKKNGVNNWKKIQGLVYGKYMKNAKLMNNFLNFLLLCEQKNHKLFIVSHKTKYGHFDKEKIELRKESLKWIKRNIVLKKKFY